MASGEKIEWLEKEFDGSGNFIYYITNKNGVFAHQNGVLLSMLKPRSSKHIILVLSSHFGRGLDTKCYKPMFVFCMFRPATYSEML